MPLTLNLPFAFAMTVLTCDKICKNNALFGLNNVVCLSLSYIWPSWEKYINLEYKIDHGLE